MQPNEAEKAKVMPNAHFYWSSTEGKKFKQHLWGKGRPLFNKRLMLLN